MTNKQKLEQLLQYYMDCYAHCEGSGCWDWRTLDKFGISAGMCKAIKFLNLKIDIWNTMPPPKDMFSMAFWFHYPTVVNTYEQNRRAIKVRINYMIKHLQP